MKKLVIYLGLVFLLVGCSSSETPTVPVDDDDDDDPGGGGTEPEITTVINHESLSDFPLLTPEQFQAIRDSLTIFYGHTSHGSQLVDGMKMLRAENGELQLPSIHEVSDDLGHNGDTSWVDITRAYLDDKAAVTQVVMWSWCGGVSDNTSAGIDTYLNAMAGLETEYPAITFVYMTGHLDGTGTDGVLRTMNTRIRDYCIANEKILFDFESIESYDPDGEYYADDTDACGWCAAWCAANDCADCDVCAHSHCFNCYRKGQGFWCLLDMILDQT